MSLVDMIKQTYSRGRGSGGSIPQDMSGLILLSRSSSKPLSPTPASKETVEKLLLQAARSYSHYWQESGKSPESLIRWLGIQYKKTGSSDYKVWVHIPDFMMGKNNEYYHFMAVDLWMPLEVNSKSVRIKEAPRVAQGGYTHPFVYCDGTICFGDLSWGPDLDISFKAYYPLSDIGNAAGKIVTVLRQGKMSIEEGYVGDPTAVHDITQFNAVAYGGDHAERYARQNGIDRHRIFEND